MIMCRVTVMALMAMCFVSTLAELRKPLTEADIDRIAAQWADEVHHWPDHLFERVTTLLCNDCNDCNALLL